MALDKLHGALGVACEHGLREGRVLCRNIAVRGHKRRKPAITVAEPNQFAPIIKKTRAPASTHQRIVEVLMQQAPIVMDGIGGKSGPPPFDTSLGLFLAEHMGGGDNGRLPVATTVRHRTPKGD